MFEILGGTMQKFVTILAMLFLTSHVYAATLSSTIVNAIKNNPTSNTTIQSQMIYGGKDISREVADANEPLWSGQPTLIG